MNLDTVMKWPLVYRSWMATHSAQKFRPVVAHNDLSQVRRVLDVGCGPGTNAPAFSHTDYLGIDQNVRYITQARRRHSGRFEVGDVTRLDVPTEMRFDFILVNSLLHHIDESSTRRLLSHLPTLLAKGGHVHILELVLPREYSLARALARADRGEFPRPLEEWHQMFTSSFDEIVFEPYDVRILGTTFWKMVYFKGRAKPNGQ